jgi:hypothetical protein
VFGHWGTAELQAPDCVTSPRPSRVHSRPPALLLTHSAVIDGSDRFILTRDTVWNQHQKRQPPQNDVFNGKPWTDLTTPPATGSEFAKDLDRHAQRPRRVHA